MSALPMLLLAWLPAAFAAPPGAPPAPPSTRGAAAAAVPLEAAAVPADPDAAPPVETPVPEAAAPTRDRAVLVFEDDLHVDTDLMLQGLASDQRIPFTVPRAWELTGDPEVNLRFDHSASLLPHRSSLTLLVNEQPVASVVLGPDNVTGGVLRARVPRALLRDYNALRIQVVQHVSEQCEDPFDPSLWTRISRASDLTLAVRPAPVEPELLDFPFPFLDERGYGPSRITLVTTPDQRPSQVQAAGEIGLALGRLVAYRRVEVQPPVTSLDALRTNGLAIGIHGHDRVVTQLLAAAPPAEHGVVAVVPAPHDPSLAILVVAGADQLGLERAVDALVGHSRYAALSGPTAVVSAVEPSAPPPYAEEHLPMARDAERATFADLGFEDTTVRGYYAESVTVPVLLEGDARVRGGARVRLRYAHSALLDPRLSAVEVRLNGVVLRSRHLDAGDEGEQELEVELPAEVLEPRNELEIGFHLFPDDYDPCGRIVPDRQLWATVFGTSEVTIPRDHFALMPDLSLLQHALWPFSLEPRDGGTTLVVGAAPDADEASAALQLAAELGRSSPAAAPVFEVAPGAALGDLVGRNVVLLTAPGRGDPLWTELLDGRHVTFAGDSADRRVGPAGELLTARVGTTYGTVEEMPHPASKDRGLLVVRAPAPGGLLATTQALVDPVRLSALAGNAAALPAAGGARVLDVARRTEVGSLSLTLRAQAWVTRNWPLVGFAVPTAAIVAAGAILGWARRRGGRT